MGSRELLDRGFIAKKMMRRIDVGADMHGHLHDVGDKTFVFPLDDRLELEIFLVRRKGCGVAFLYSHAQIDDAHSEFPPR